MAFFQHPQAIVETQLVGEGTTIWAFAHILPGARIGRDCNICDHTFIENDVVVGDRVTIKCGVQLWDGIVVEDDVFLGPNATFTNDPFPRSKRHPHRFQRTVIKKGASIGANATILPGLTVGEQAMIGAGAVLTHNAPPYAILAGNPARIKGYADVRAERPFQPETAPPVGSHAAEVDGVVLHRMPLIDDLRGRLSFGEYQRQVPFPIHRYFLVFGVSSKHIRGEHAHKTLHQFLVCVHGRCNVVVDDGRHRQEFILDSPSIGVYIPPMVWAVQYQYSPDAVLLVLASDYYDPRDYVRDYAEFLAIRSEHETAPAR
jgi:acetyltransferase-like isoleucine patch superfamily enzyme/dTDP-4-dehydrorhamnose 3,5-epimerase-like enzyme